jgi:hypothetical protein
MYEKRYKRGGAGRVSMARWGAYEGGGRGPARQDERQQRL